MLKKLMMFAGLLGGSVLFSGQALAAADWGACTPDGGTHVFSATLNKTITDTSKNASGIVFRDFWSWDLGGDYDAVCECPEGTATASTYYKATSPLAPGHSEGERQYFIINNNIQISVDVWVQGHYQDYKTAPFSNLDNLSAARAGCTVGDVRFT